MSKMIRMTEETSDYLDVLAKETDKNKQDLLALAVHELFKKHFFERAEKAYAELRKDEKAWQAELAERALWETTAADGLDKDGENNDY